MNGKQVQAKADGDNFDIVVLKFADSKIPSFVEKPNSNFIQFGEKNDYPEYCIYQYNKCGKHRAIINGKSRYILGDGLEGTGGLAETTNPDGTTSPAAKVNADGETMYDVLQKSIKDVEIHGGFRWFVQFDMTGKVASIKHADFAKFRTAKPIEIKDKEGNVVSETNKGFWFKEKWFNDRGYDNRKEEAVFYPEFGDQDTAEGVKRGTEVFAYNEYGPGTDWYPLPEYVGCANYIDTDIEISKFHLSAIRNGMMPSKLIQFYTGEPGEDKKKEIEARFAKKFAGSENAGKFVLVFNPNKDKQVDISDLSFNELDKQFDLLAKTVQQEIFTGHQVVSPMLFGVKTEGQLGGTTELRVAYEVFINTYAKPKQGNYEKVVNYFGGLMGKGSGYKFKQLDPVGIVFDPKDFLADIPKDYVMEKLGIPKQYITPQAVPGASPVATATNENVRNLTAKQNEQLMRVIRQYSRGKLTKEQAAMLLKTGIGFSDEEIEVLLYVPANEDEDASAVQAMNDEIKGEDFVIGLFAAAGDLKKDFHIIKSKKVKFSSDLEAAVDELGFRERLAMKTTVTITEANILDLISKDKRITPEVIAKTLNASVEYITGKIASMTKSGLLTSTQQVIGDDIQIERTLTKPLRELDAPPSSELETNEILIKYSYEGPKDDRNRPFCAKMLSLDRLYSRAEIENISMRLGYSVFDRRGGWWTKPNGTHSPSCRHRWQSNIVVRKKKGGVL